MLPGPGPPPCPLGATAKDAEGLEELAGEYVARAFFSKNWQLRDAALGYLAKQVSGLDAVALGGVGWCWDAPSPCYHCTVHSLQVAYQAIHALLWRASSWPRQCSLGCWRPWAAGKRAVHRVCNPLPVLSHFAVRQLQQGELAGRSDAFRTLCRIMQVGGWVGGNGQACWGQAGARGERQCARAVRREGWGRLHGQKQD